MKLVLFFTRGISLRVWDTIGSLDREIALYRELAQRVERIYFLTYGDASEQQYQTRLPPNVELLTNRWRLPTLLYSLLIPILYRRELGSAAIYKTNQMDGAWSALLAALLYRKKLIIRSGYELLSFLERQRAGWVKRALIKVLERFAYTFGDVICVASLSDKQYIIETFKIASQKIQYLPNYVDTDVFRPLALPKDPHRVLFVGRLVEQKNLENLITAIAGTPLRLVVIGRGPLENKLKELARASGATVEFRGNVPHAALPEEINRAALFVLPSWYEGCPKTLLEAMACGAACVGTDVEGINTVVRHRENGYLSQTDSGSIHHALLEVQADSALRKRVGEAARRTIEEGFSLESVVDKEWGIYSNLT